MNLDGVKKSNICLDLNVKNSGFEFATSIDNAIDQTSSALVVLNEDISTLKELGSHCDALDYALAASSGALCGIIDVFLVGKPGETSLGEMTDKWFSARVMDFAGRCHPEKKSFDSLDSAVRFLEQKFKVPYDQTGLGDAGRDVFGLNAKNHHFKSLAHNPSLLGLFFSILDQFSNTSHFITDGKLVSLELADERWELQGGCTSSKLFCAFVNWFGHLVSDVSGSQSSARAGKRGMGLPSPLWTWINDIIAVKEKLGLNAAEIDKAINELAIKIFEEGYDVRFQATQAVPVLVNELFVRVIYATRRMIRYFSSTSKVDRSFSLMWKVCEPFSNSTVKRMLAVAHGTFCMVDVGDAAYEAVVRGNGGVNVVELVLRINVVGIGRFAISLYGETKRVLSCGRTSRNVEATSNAIIILDNYLEGLKILAKKYDDAHLLTFVSDFQASGAYVAAFGKSAELAELRNVPADKILRTKADIDNYFGGK